MTQTIEQLRARIAELEEENARLVKLDAKRKKQLSDFDDVIDDLNVAVSCINPVEDLKRAVANLKEQAAASQAYAEQLREAFKTVATGYEIGSAVSANNDHTIKLHYADQQKMEDAFDALILQLDKALALPRDTSALDAYVAEKVKEARPDFSQMREMLRAMQAGELTVSRGIEILDMWHAGNWNDNMLPPVRQDLIEEDSMPVEIIDRCNQQISTLTRQRDLAVEALTEIRTFPRYRMPADIANEALSTIKESEVK